MAFDRLLSVAKLTPAQATLLAGQLLDAADRRGADEPVDTRLGAVTLMPSGELDVQRPYADGGTPVSLLLEQLLQNARDLPAHPRPEQLQLLHALEEVAQDSSRPPGVRARTLEHAVTDTLGPTAQQRVAGQLAALTRAFTHVAAPSLAAPSHAAPLAAPAVPAPESPATLPVEVPLVASTAPGAASGAARGAPPPAAAGRPAPSRSSTAGRTRLRRRAPGGRAALVLLVLGALLATSAYVVLRGPGLAFFDSVGNAAQPAGPDPSSSARPSDKSAQQPRPHRRQAVPTLASRQAGRITGVAVQRTGSCRPGSLCPVTVTVHLRPASTSQPVTWRVGAARLCTRGVSWSPPITVTAQPGWTTVYAASSVRVPDGRSLALVGLTSAPARAQSRPVPVLGSSLHC